MRYLAICLLSFHAALSQTKYVCTTYSNSLIKVSMGTSGYDGWGNCINNAISSLGDDHIVVDLGGLTYTTNRTDDFIDLTGAENITITSTNGMATIQNGSQVIDVYLEITDANNILIENVKFYGVNRSEFESDNHRAINIRKDLETTRNITIKNCYFQGFKTGGIHLEYVKAVYIHDNEFNDVDNKYSVMTGGIWGGSDLGAIHVHSSDSIYIVKNLMKNLVYSGISATPSTNVVIDNNDISFDPTGNGYSSKYSMGINIEGGINNSRITNNKITGVFLEGIIITASDSQEDPVTSTGNDISGNYILSHGYGIMLNHQNPNFLNKRDINENTITNNQIFSLDDLHYGIYGYNASRNVVKGNTVSTNGLSGSHGIFFDDGSRGNHIERNTVSGFSSNCIYGKYGQYVGKNSISNCEYGVKIVVDEEALIYWNFFQNVSTPISIPNQNYRIGN